MLLLKAVTCMPMPPNLSARGWVVDSKGSARVRLDKINYPDASATTPISWEFKIDIQPSS